MNEFTSEQREHRAREAKRLLNEPLLAEVMDEIRHDAREKLATIDADDKNGILRLQAIDANMQALFDGLNAILLAGDASKSGGIEPERDSEPE